MKPGDRFIQAMADAGEPTAQQFIANRKAKVCVCCGKAPTSEEMATWTQAGRNDWVIAGICEPCFDGLGGEE